MFSKLRDVLLNNSYKGNLGKDADGYIACLLATMNNKPEVVRLLLAAGIGVGC